MVFLLVYRVETKIMESNKHLIELRCNIHLLFSCSIRAIYYNYFIRVGNNLFVRLPTPAHVT